MYRILIADDEALEREGLELMISRLMPNQFQFFHAENGRRAIQFTEEHRPDIVFMDIKMPGIQGLEAIKEINARYPNTKMILVTAYDYFNYAQEAVALGVKDYILKPAKKEQIVECLQKLLAELEQENRRRGEELELKEKLSQLLPLVENELAIMLMLDFVQEIDLKYLAEMLDAKWDKGYAMVLSIHRGKGDTDQGALSHEVKKQVHEAVKSFMKPRLPCIVSPMIGSQIALFLPLEQDGFGYSQRVESLEWGRKLRQWLEKQLELSIAVGIGTVQPGMEGLRQSYHEAVMVSSDPSAIVNVRHYDDIQQGPRQAGISPDDEKTLREAMQRLDEDEARAKFSAMFEKLAASTAGSFEVCSSEMTVLFLSLARYFAQQGIPVDAAVSFTETQHLDQLRQQTEHRLAYMLSVIREERERRNGNVIDRAIRFIHDRYKEELSMEEAAEHVNLSPYYFSKMFKTQIGATFIDYLTDLRITEAKRLIAQQELSLKEICYEVGYRDPNYFSRVFKKVTGVTPSEYRHQP
ncbi:response regulator [Paenibacillus turpanensis]|uniref:response regulator n=1 Tax=Paenibacillus turpanensis TaxID=2689078 RepID=UPI0014087D80|nr:response regulator [Paenibacillus turpanensis]